jgi:hypothetical protein
LITGGTVRNSWFVCLFIMVFGLMCSAAQRGGAPANGEQFVGTWSGTWDAQGASGGFELTLEKGKAGSLDCRVSVTGEPAYKARCKSVSFEGKDMSAKYDFPPDEAADVVLAVTFDEKKAKGTWSLRAKAGNTEVASGTLNFTRQ